MTSDHTIVFNGDPGDASGARKWLRRIGYCGPDTDRHHHVPDDELEALREDRRHLQLALEG